MLCVGKILSRAYDSSLLTVRKLSSCTYFKGVNAESQLNVSFQTGTAKTGA